MPKVNRNHLFGFKFFLPEVSQQKNIAKRFDELSYETQQLETIYRKKLAMLAELKQSLLQKAFAGELTAEPEASLKQEAMV